MSASCLCRHSMRAPAPHLSRGKDRSACLRRHGALVARYGYLLARVTHYPTARRALLAPHQCIDCPWHPVSLRMARAVTSSDCCPRRRHALPDCPTSTVPGPTSALHPAGINPATALLSPTAPVTCARPNLDPLSRLDHSRSRLAADRACRTSSWWFYKTGFDKPLLRLAGPQQSAIRATTSPHGPFGRRRR